MESTVKAEIQRLIRSLPRGGKSRLADAVGVKPSTVTKWVQGETIPGVENWLAIAAFFDLPPDHFSRLDAEGSSLVDQVNALAQMIERQSQEIAGLQRALGLSAPPKS